jgi:hypothetical protein
MSDFPILLSGSETKSGFRSFLRFTLNDILMFGDMMSQMQEMQEQMQKQLAAEFFTAEAGGGAVMVTCTGARGITNVKISPELLDPEDAEGLEDLIVVATNRALEKAAEYEQGQAGSMMNNMLPGGLGSMFGG